MFSDSSPAQSKSGEAQAARASEAFQVRRDERIDLSHEYAKLSAAGLGLPVASQLLQQLSEQCDELLASCQQERTQLGYLSESTMELSSEELLRSVSVCIENLPELLEESQLSATLEEFRDELLSQRWGQNVPSAQLELFFPLLNVLKQQVDLQIAQIDSELFVTKFKRDYQSSLQEGESNSEMSYRELAEKSHADSALREYVAAADELETSPPEVFSERIPALLESCDALLKEIAPLAPPRISYLGSDKAEIEPVIELYEEVLNEIAALEDELSDFSSDLAGGNSVDAQLSSFAALSSALLRRVRFEFVRSAHSGPYPRLKMAEVVLPEFAERMEGLLGKLGQYSSQLSASLEEH